MHLKVDYEEELRYCTGIKTVLMILVIIGHCCDFWTGNWFTKNPAIEAKGIAYFSDWINSFHTYSFVLISGYIFRYIRTEGGYKVFKEFLEKKIRRLVIPYIFVSVVWVIPISIFYLNWDNCYIIKSFLLATNPSQLWFLLMLFWVSIICWMLERYLKTDIVAFIITSFVYLLGVLLGHFIPNYFCIPLACRYFLFFVIGMKLREKKLQFLRKIPLLVYVLLDVFIFCLLKWISMQTGIVFKLLELILGMVLNVVGSLLAFWGIQKLIFKSNIIEKKWFVYLGNASMTMYLFHQQFIYITLSLLNGKIPPLIHVFINFIFSFLCSLIISDVIHKNKILQYMVGEKNK